MDKVRPVVIVSAEHGNKFSDYVIVAGITSKLSAKPYPINVSLDDGDPLPGKGEIRCGQLYTLLKADLKEYRDTLREDQIEALDEALRSALELN